VPARAVHDITRPLGEDVPLYPGDPKPSFRRMDRDDYTCTWLRLTTHTGTHLDAPLHYLAGGTPVDRIPLERLVGPVQVLGMEDGEDAITAGDLKGRISGKEGVLLRTRASGEGSFGREFPHLTPDAARFLAEAGPAVVGIDSPSVESPESDGSVHRVLLGAGIPLLELLDLSGIEEGGYFMVALPLRLEGLDGSPVRVILMEREAGAA